MFIVIEGIDGAGCETQGKNLLKMLNDNQKNASLIKYPDYERNVGKLIKDFLYENKKLTAEQQFLLYATQFVMDVPMIKEKRGSHLPPTNYELQPILIADRYFTTTLCYQTLEGIRLEKALSFAEDFGIEKPDLVFYIKVDPDIAIKRKSGEQKEKNFREKDFDFIRKTYAKYEELAKNQVWAKWVTVDGNKSIDEVTKEIYNEIQKLKVSSQK